MRDYFKIINSDSPRKVVVEKKVKRWDISLYKLNYETAAGKKAAIKALSKFSDKNFVVVFPKLEIEALRRALQRFNSENSYPASASKIVLYTHEASEMGILAGDVKKIERIVCATTSYYAYLITVPKGVAVAAFVEYLKTI